MRKGRDGGEKNGKKKKREKTDEYSGHYVIASSRPPQTPTAGTPLDRANRLSQLTKLELSIIEKLQPCVDIFLSQCSVFNKDNPWAIVK